MQKEFALQSMSIISRQRNFFLALSMMLVVCLFLVSLKLAVSEERTILVPGLQQEVWVSKEGVASSYLEQNAVMYLPMLLDLDATSIDWKRDRVLEYVSTSDAQYLKGLSEYFAKVKEHYTKFSLSTHFALKKLITNPKTLTVTAYGQLISRFGNRGFEQESVAYSIKYDWIGGRLLLKEFLQIKKEDLDEND